MNSQRLNLSYKSRNAEQIQVELFSDPAKLFLAELFSTNRILLRENKISSHYTREKQAYQRRNLATYKSRKIYVNL